MEHFAVGFVRGFEHLLLRPVVHELELVVEIQDYLVVVILFLLLLLLARLLLMLLLLLLWLLLLYLLDLRLQLFWRMMSPFWLLIEAVLEHFYTRE